MRRVWLSLAAIACTNAAVAQSSASFNVKSYVFNAGGHPSAGTILASPSFRVTLDAVGEGAAALGASSPSFSTDAGFAVSFPPPGEVTDLLFGDKVTLAWDAERSVGSYHLYRDPLSDLPGLGFGTCEQAGLASATATDPDVPIAGQGFFYVVTAENCLDEEGTKGYQSSGAERGNSAPCP